MLALAVALAALHASGCASSGPRISAQAVERIQPGVTTRDQIRAAFGEPSGRYVSGSGGSRWVYRRGDSDPANEALMSDVTNDVLGAAGSRSPVNLPNSAYSLPAVANKPPRPENLTVDFDTSGVVVDFEYVQGE